jgi:hypothetical protein
VYSIDSRVLKRFAVFTSDKVNNNKLSFIVLDLEVTFDYLPIYELAKVSDRLKVVI